MDKRVVVGVMKSNDDSGDEAEWEDVDDDEQIDIFAVDTKCLFCKENALLPAVIEHMKLSHSFDVYELKTVHKFSCYEYICFVNYIRSQNPKVESVKQQFNGERQWRNDKYLKPVHEDEPFLLLDIDNEDDAEMEAADSGTPMAVDGRELVEMSECSNAATPQLFTPAVANSNASDDSKKLVMLQQQAAALFAENRMLRSTMKQLIEEREGDDDEEDEDDEVAETNGDEATKPKKTENGLTGAKQAAKAEDDEWYFDSYDDFQIHLEMLTDRVRTDAYRDFVQRNASIFANKTVLDVGCGTSILSMFVARDTAAERVFAVDRAAIAFDAMAIVRENSLAQRVTVKHARVEDLEPQRDVQEATSSKRKAGDIEHVDIIVSEWMGYALLYECMLDSVLAARDMFTVRGATNSVPLVFPNVYSVWFAGVDDSELTNRYVNYWNDVYGFSMSTMRGRVCRSVLQDTLTSPSRIVTNAARLREYDLATLQLSDLEPYLLFSEFELCARPAKDNETPAAAGTQISAFCLWFDVAFTGCPQPVTFSTSPHGTRTHWQQSFMFLEEPIQLGANEKLDCRIAIRRNPKEPRHLIIDLFVNGQLKTYHMS